MFHSPFLFFLACSVLLATLTWQAQRSGQVMGHYGVIARDDKPISFGSVIVARWIGVALSVAVAGATLTGWRPPILHG